MRTTRVLVAAAAGSLATAPAPAQVVTYRFDCTVESNTIATGPLAGVTGAIALEFDADTSVQPSVPGPPEALWADNEDIKTGARLATRFARCATFGTEAQNTVSSVALTDNSQDLGGFTDSFVLSLSGDTDLTLTLEQTFVAPVGSFVDGLTLPSTPGPVSLTPFLSGPNAVAELFVAGDAQGESLVASVTAFTVLADPTPVVCQLEGDVTTTNTNPGDECYGEPDGVVDGADLSYYVERWLTNQSPACP